MQPQGSWKFVRLVKIEGSNHLPDILPQLFPRVTFGHDCLGQTLSAIPSVGFLNHFEDEFPHASNSKLPMPEQQVPAWQTRRVTMGAIPVCRGGWPVISPLNGNMYSHGGHGGHGKMRKT